MFEVLGDPAIYEFENAPPTDLARLTQRFTRLETRVSPDGSRAVGAVMEELRQAHGATDILAVLKTRNVRSTGLLRKLGFVPASAERAAQLRDEADESVFVHGDPRHPAP
jgi:hypothetical protein